MLPGLRTASRGHSHAHTAGDKIFSKCFHLFATIRNQSCLERCLIWAHACYLYIRNAPGSSAKQAMSPDSRAFSAQSSRSSSCFCCCHGSMTSQVLGAASPTKIDFSHKAIICGILWWKISPLFSYCSTPAAFLCTTTCSRHHISHPPGEGHLGDWQSPRPDP